jgi:hypothetical protein
VYEELESLLADYGKTPSFMGSGWTLDWDGSCYRAELTDANNCLSGFNFGSSDPSVSAVASGSVLTVTAEKPLSGAVTIIARKELTQVDGEGLTAILSAPQNLCEALRTKISFELIQKHICSDDR